MLRFSSWWICASIFDWNNWNNCNDERSKRRSHACMDYALQGGIRRQPNEWVENGACFSSPERMKLFGDILMVKSGALCWKFVCLKGGDCPFLPEGITMDLPFVCRSFPLTCVGDSNGRVRGKQREAALTLLSVYWIIYNSLIIKFI